MRSFLIIGLGRFGRIMAAKLEEQGNEVLAIDRSEERVNDALQYVTNIQIGDATSQTFIESLGVGNFDTCVVAIGDDFQSSLEATALLKEFGAPHVVARATRDVHKKFLVLAGADDVVYSERETAERLAVCYGSGKVFDYMQLTDGYAIFEIAMPESWAGKTIIEMAVRQKYGVSILAIRENGHLNTLPPPEHVFSERETLMVLGHETDVKKLIK